MNASIDAIKAFAPSLFRSFVWPMLWQSSLLIALVFGLDLALKRKLRASVRYALWLVVLVKLLLPPSLALPTGLGWWVRPSTPLSSATKAPAPVVVTYGLNMAPVALTTLVAPLPAPPPRSTASAGFWAILVWSGVSLGFLAFMLLRWRQVARNAYRSPPAQTGLTDCVDEARCAVGLRRPVRVRLTSDSMSPAVCGLFRFVILLPEVLVSRLGPAQLRAVLLHELIHLRRGDIWMNCAQALLQIVYWWHPLLWLANARIRRVREEAVDDAVMLALRDDAETYAATLLEVAKLAFRRPLTALGLVGILESRTSLRQRIERLIDFHPPRKAGLTLVSALAVLAFAAAAVPMGEGPAPRKSAAATMDGKLDSSSPQTKAKPFVTRSFRIEPDLFRAKLRELEDQSESAPWYAPGETFDASSEHSADLKLPSGLANWVRSLGMDISPPKSIFFSDSGGLLVHATLSDVEKIRADVRQMTTARPPVEGQGTNTTKAASAEYKAAFKSRENVSLPPDESYRDPNLVYTNRARRAIHSKLDKIRLAEVKFDDMALSEVIANLSEQAKRRDLEKKGINFILNRGPEKADQTAVESVDIARVSIRIVPSLTDVRLADVLDAIVKVADKPIKYSVEDYGVVFSLKVLEAPPLYTRVFKVNPDTFLAGLSRQTGLTTTNIEVFRRWFKSLDVNITPPKNFFFNDGEGTLIVRAALYDLDVIGQAVTALNVPPPLIKIRATFIELPEAEVKAFWESYLDKHVSADDLNTGTTQIPEAQVRQYLTQWQSTPEVRILSEASVTTESGRKTEIQVGDTISVVTYTNSTALGPAPTEPHTNEVPIGTLLDLLPRVSGDRVTVQLVITASVTDFLGYGSPGAYIRTNQDVFLLPPTVALPLPHFRVHELYTQAKARVRDGRTLVMFAGMINGSKMNGNASRLGDGKPLLIFITPTIIDPAGNRVHADVQPAK